MSPVDDAIRDAAHEIAVLTAASGEDVRVLRGTVEGILRSLVETVQRSQWREMDSAPKDGTPILCYFPDEPDRRRHMVGFYLPNVPAGVFGGLFGFDFTAPTLWMPLPAPPQTREET